MRDGSSVAGYDLPDDLSLSASWEMLLGRGRLIDVRNEPALSLVSGWRINQVSAETSGMPFTITTSGGFVNIGNRNEDRGEWVGKARWPCA